MKSMQRAASIYSKQPGDSWLKLQRASVYMSAAVQKRQRWIQWQVEAYHFLPERLVRHILPPLEIKSKKCWEQAAAAARRLLKLLSLLHCQERHLCKMLLPGV